MYKLVIFDIDGIFTDGTILLDEIGKEYKSYCLTELDTLYELKQDGYHITAITGECTTITEILKRRFPWDAFLFGCRDKVVGIRSLEKQFHVSADEICYIGDGKYDVPAIKYAGLGVAPANAIDEAKDAADVVLSGIGGRDCIRNLRKLLLSMKNKDVEPNPSAERKKSVSALDRFRVDDRICVITGGAGLMGRNHAGAVLSGGGIPVLLDISEGALISAKDLLRNRWPNGEIVTCQADITNRISLERLRDELLERYGHIDALINNAANNPKMETSSANMGATSFEAFPLSLWQDDIAVGLTGSLLCSQVFGVQMARQGKGVILNISSDLGVIAPDQRIYRKEGLREEEQTVKPVTYSVIKHGLIGLTKYIATYWAEKGVRCNALCPAGIENGQDAAFIRKLTNLVPMGRMATKDEYQSTVLYMVSDASAYMTGATVIVDGGRTCW